MQIWPAVHEQNKTCCGLDAISDARQVCWQIDIPHYVMNFRDEFDRLVVDYFCREYMRGRTPNPCIACNRYIKFELFCRKALAMGADYIATGHYAQIIYNEDLCKYELYRGTDEKKDQSYALYTLNQNQLQHLILPLGGLRKQAVRTVAGAMGLAVAEKADSQEICFVSKDYAEFVEEYLGVTPLPGEIIDANGRLLGYHQGVHHYTMGQRKGLGIALGDPVYINGLDPVHNIVQVGDIQSLLKTGLLVEDVNYISGEAPAGDLQVNAKIRYSATAEPAKLIPEDGNRARLRFEVPQKAITPGQAVVFYQGDKVLGECTISEVLDP